MLSTSARQLVALVLALGVLAGAAIADQPRDSRPLGPAPESNMTASRSLPAPGGAGTVRTIASLLLVLGVIGVGALGFKKLASRHPALAASLGAPGRSPAGILEIVGRYPMGRGASLVLLRLDNRILLLSQSAGASGRGLLRGGAALTTLCEITSGDDVASILAKAREAEGETMTAKFQSLLSTFAKAPDTDEPVQAPHDPEEPARPSVVVRSGAWSSGVGGAA